MERLGFITICSLRICLSLSAVLGTRVKEVNTADQVVAVSSLSFEPLAL